MSTLSVTSASEFYQRHESKIITLVVVLLALYLIAFAAKLTWRLIPQSEQQQSASQLSSSPKIGTVARTDSGSNIAKIIRLNLFGNAQAVPEVEQVVETTKVPETQLNLVLSGVVSSSQSSLGAAIIAYRNKQETYGIGDKIEGTNVTLDEIFVDRVIIKNRLTRETLMLDGIDFDEANQQRNRNNSTTTTNQDPQTPQRTARPDPKLLKDARAKLAESPDSFAEMISLSPHRLNNELIGYRVSPGANPALFNSVGLKNGDIVVELNGLDLSDLQQSLEALNELQEADTLQLEILRSGDYVSLDFDIQGVADDE